MTLQSPLQHEAPGTINPPSSDPAPDTNTTVPPSSQPLNVTTQNVT